MPTPLLAGTPCLQPKGHHPVAGRRGHAVVAGAGAGWSVRYRVFCICITQPDDPGLHFGDGQRSAGAGGPGRHRRPATGAPVWRAGVEPVPETADRAAHLGVPTRIPVHDGATGVLQLGDRCGYGFVYTTTLFEHRARPKCYGKTRMASRVDQRPDSRSRVAQWAARGGAARWKRTPW